MRSFLVGLLAVLLVACGVASQAVDTPLATATNSATPMAATPRASSPTGPSAATCASTDQDQHVYNPDRLQVHSACIRVTGTVAAIRNEADGDRICCWRWIPLTHTCSRPPIKASNSGTWWWSLCACMRLHRPMRSLPARQILIQRPACQDSEPRFGWKGGMCSTSSMEGGLSSIRYTAGGPRIRGLLRPHRRNLRRSRLRLPHPSHLRSPRLSRSASRASHRPPLVAPTQHSAPKREPPLIAPSWSSTNQVRRPPRASGQRPRARPVL